MLINLAANDFGRNRIPDEQGWTTRRMNRSSPGFVKNYPNAEIYVASVPMMGDWDEKKSLTVLKKYLAEGSSGADRKAAGDAKVHEIDSFDAQDRKNGLGSDWHPSL